MPSHPSAGLPAVYAGLRGHVPGGAAGEHLRDQAESILCGPFFVGTAVLQPFDPQIAMQSRPMPDVESEGVFALDARRIDV